MPDLDEQLVGFGRWLDHEIASLVADRRPPGSAGRLGPVGPVCATNRSPRRGSVAQRRARRHHLGTLVLAGVVSAAAAVAILLVVSTGRRPDAPLVPGLTTVPTTPPSTSVPPRSSLPAVTPTGTGTTSAPATASPTVPADSSAAHPTVVSAAASRPAIAPTTVPPPTSAAVVTSTTAAPSSAPDPTTVTTPPPPTTPPSTVAGAPCSTGVKSARRNSVFYRLCASSVSLTGAVPAAGWSQGQVLSAGPPVVSVRFEQPSTGDTVTCTISADGDGIVTGSGDC